MESVPCPICNLTKEEPYLVCRDYISEEAFRVVRCVLCGVIYVNPRPAHIARYYPVRHQSSKPAAYERADARSRIRFVSDLLAGKPARILDVGCGKGLLLAGLKEKGWATYGTELSEVTSSVAKSSGITVFSCPVQECPFEREYFDVITLFHSLEHLPDPQKTLSHLQYLLKPAGLLVIEVPNIGSWHARVFDKDWFHLDVPRHLTHFSQDSLTRMVDAADLRIIKMTTHNIQYDAFGALQSLLNKALPTNLLNNFNTKQITLADLWGQPGRVFNMPALLISELVLWLGFPLLALAEICSARWVEGGTLRAVAVPRG